MHAIQWYYFSVFLQAQFIEALASTLKNALLGTVPVMYTAAASKWSFHLVSGFIPLFFESVVYLTSLPPHVGASGHTVSLLAVTFVLVLEYSTRGEGNWVGVHIQCDVCSSIVTIAAAHIYHKYSELTTLTVIDFLNWHLVQVESMYCSICYTVIGKFVSYYHNYLI